MIQTITAILSSFDESVHHVPVVAAVIALVASSNPIGDGQGYELFKEMALKHLFYLFHIHH